MDKISCRVMAEVDYLLDTKKTIREIARVFGVSKSAVHKDLTERLFKIDRVKFSKARDVLNYHIDVRHIRGGESTKKKYQKLTSSYK